ncbi:KEOPS complex subunit Cgi121 [Pyrococcus kukulkanii]|uniref:KEOPS complex subunit Cgi121 n=1 Tax=Pyrococcus kukulkanii TaxID=1609559 RepID=UPI003569AA5B
MKEITTKFGKICIVKVHLTKEKVELLINICGENCQIVKADCPEEVTFATLLALKAFIQGRNKARTVKGEILLRLAGVRQIREAINLVGAREGENFIVTFGTEDPCKLLAEILSKIGVVEVTLNECDKEIVKKSFERIAMTETL